MPQKHRLISHSISPESVEASVKKIAERIIREGDKNYTTVQEQLSLLQQLSEFDLGRFMIQHGGLNGYWTHYVLTHPEAGRISGENNRGENFSDLEKEILDCFPTTLATQERFKIFLQENQKAVKNKAKLACIPCGMMGELLYLDFDGMDDLELVGVDLDPGVFEDANDLATSRNFLGKIKLLNADAWGTNFSNEFNLISSNGLTIYEASDDKLTELYAIFYRALVPGGKLVTSFLTYPPTFPDKTEWDMQKILPEKALRQRIIFSDILQSKFMVFRTTEQAIKQLAEVGFKDIDIIRDNANIFPTVVAVK